MYMYVSVFLLPRFGEIKWIYKPHSYAVKSSGSGSYGTSYIFQVIGNFLIQNTKITLKIKKTDDVLPEWMSTDR